MVYLKPADVEPKIFPKQANILQIYLSKKPLGSAMKCIISP